MSDKPTIVDRLRRMQHNMIEGKDDYEHEVVGRAANEIDGCGRC